ncbi:MAG: mycofactocin biosynthesis glycosyltransferase MftF [Acidimicrobiales bacterium]
MSQLLPVAPLPVELPIPIGTRVVLDEEAKFLDRDLLSGGAPWRLLRLPGGSKVVAERWRGGGEVRAGEERFARTLVQQGLLHPLFRGEISIDDVDVVIPVHDDAASLSTLLTSLVGLHLTVVDDGSSDALSIERAARSRRTNLIRLEENAGPGAARNTGARATLRPFIWFIDVDVVLDNPINVLARLLAQMDDPLQSVVAPRIRGTSGPSSRERFEQRFSPLDMGSRSGLVVPGGAVPYVPSACLLVRRASFGSGFDESLRIGEDVDLVWRLHDQGWLARYLADVVVTHQARTNWVAWWRQRVSYGESASALAKLHGTRLAPFRADTWTLLAWSSALIGKPMVGLRIIEAARNQLRERMLDTTDDAGKVADELVGRGMVRAGGPMARAAVRTFGLAILVSALHPKLRKRALLLFALGTSWRWRSTKVHPLDVPLALVDDAAYGVGVVKGAITSRSLGALRPHITKSTLGLRNVLGLKKGAGGAAQKRTTPRMFSPDSRSS